MSFDKRKTLQNALLYTQQGKWDRAIAEYEAVVKADPADLSVCNNLGDLYARAGRIADAIGQYRKLGESYRNDGLSVKAIAVYKKIAKLDPEWTAAYQACAELYLEQGLVGEAKLQLTTAAQQYAKAGETKKVIEISQRMAQLDPSNVPLLSKLAELLVTEGQAEAAAVEFERAAKAAEAAGQAADAKRLLKKARELAPAAPAAAEAPAPLGAAERPAVVSFEAAPVPEAPAEPAPSVPAPEGEADLTGLELLLEEPEAQPAGAPESASVTVGDEDAGMMAMPELRELQQLHAPRSDETVGQVPVEVDEPPRAVPPPELLVEPEPLPVAELATPPVTAMPPPPARAAEEASAQEAGPPGAAEVTEPEGTGDVSLAFLGDSLGLGNRDVAEDHAQAGRAGEQLAEAEVYLKYGLEAKARERLREVIKLSPNSVTARRKLKTLYQQQHLIEEACSQIAAIAEILEGRDRHDAALEEVREGLTLAPDHPDLLRLLEEFSAGPGAPPPPSAPTIAETVQPEPGPADAAAAPPGPLVVDLESLLSPAVELGQPDAVVGPGEPVENAEDLQVVELPEEAELPDIPDLVVIAGAPRPGAARTPAAPAPPPPVPEVEAMPGAEQDPGLPPELQALIEGSADTPPAQSSGGEDDSAVAEDLAEAEFYLGQGMAEEAQAVCRRLQATYPRHPGVAALVAKLTERDARVEPPARASAPPPTPPASPQATRATPRPGRGEEARLEDVVPQFRVQDAPAPTGEPAFVNLGAELAQELEVEEARDTERTGGLLVDGLLKEFQRGVREQVDDKDFETHYNLGIAYKEMDLYDEAIQEFRLSGRDPKRALESADLLGLCFLAKGQAPQALTELQAGLALSGYPAEAYRSLRYDLGLAHEGLGQVAEAVEQFEALQKEDPRFRDVQTRLQALRARLPKKAAARPAPAPAAPTRPQPSKTGTRKISFI